MNEQVLTYDGSFRFILFAETVSTNETNRGIAPAALGTINTRQARMTA